MGRSRKGHARLALALAVSLAISPAVVAEEDAPATEPTGSRLKGRVVGTDGDTPIAGAKVMLYHLSSEQAVFSEPTGSKGDFEIPSLTYGYFDLAVATDEGLFVANQVINIPPSGKAVVVLTLRRFAAATPSSERRPFPASDQSPVGVAMLSEKLVGAAFWRSPKGMAVIGGAGGGLLLLLVGGSDSPNSPFM